MAKMTRELAPQWWPVLPPMTITARDQGREAEVTRDGERREDEQEAEG